MPNTAHMNYVKVPGDRSRLLYHTPFRSYIHKTPAKVCTLYAMVHVIAVSQYTGTTVPLPAPHTIYEWLIKSTAMHGVTVIPIGRSNLGSVTSPCSVVLQAELYSNTASQHLKITRQTFRWRGHSCVGCRRLWQFFWILSQRVAHVNYYGSCTVKLITPIAGTPCFFQGRVTVFIEKRVCRFSEKSLHP